MKDLNGELITQLALATEDKKVAALRMLRGELSAADSTRPTITIEPFVTMRDVGRGFNVSPCSLWRWGIPGHDLGGRRRFRMSEVAEYLQSPAFKQRVEDLRQKRRTGGTGARTVTQQDQEDR